MTPQHVLQPPTEAVNEKRSTAVDSYAAVVIGAVALAVGCFAVIASALRLPLSVPPIAIGSASAVALILAGALRLRGRMRGRVFPFDVWPVSLLATGAMVLLLLTLYHFAQYIRLPVDLLSFAESPFVTDILKLRTGQPLYTPVGDNNSYPYTPGSQILTYAISAALGHGDDIAFFRTVQFGYVVAAAW